MGAEEDQQNRKNEQPRANSITHAQFLSWKRQKDADASARKDEAARKRAEEIAAGTVQMNGHTLCKSRVAAAPCQARTLLASWRKKVSSYANYQLREEILVCEAK